MSSSLLPAAVFAPVVALVFSAAAQAAMVLQEDWSSHAIGGSIHSANGWDQNTFNNKASNADKDTVADPLANGDHVAQLVSGGVEYRNGLSSPIAQNTTGTLFFTFAATEGSHDVSVGLATGPGSNTYAGRVRLVNGNLQYATGAGGAGWTDSNLDYAINTGYNVWLVADNTANHTRIYIQGGGFADVTEITSAAVPSTWTPNAIKQGALVNILLRTENGNDGTPSTELSPFFIDNFHLDTEGDNRANPIAEPG